MLLHVAIARENNVWPIVKTGAGNRDIIDESRRTAKSGMEIMA
jgi:acetolactate synthase-1/2/3 large subunit